jgi:hypothetical protein
MEIAGYTIIEVYADFIYFIAVGDKTEIRNFVDELNKSNKDSGIKYLASRIDIPLTICCEQLQKTIKKRIEIAPSIESAQSHAFAQGFKKRSYTVVVLEDVGDKSTVSFPRLELNDDDDPEELIIKWLKKRVHKIPKGIKKTIRPVTLVGPDEDILVYVAKLRTQVINNTKTRLKRD